MAKIFATLETLLAFVIVFGVLVFVHELGHFFMAKLMKIRVEVFSWGIGKRLFGIKKGDTDYRVSLIPIGGFVKFSGEEAYEQKKELAPNDFMAKKRWERFLVLVTGSLMNIFLALVLVSIISMVGVTVPEYSEQKPVIGWIDPGSPAESANLKVDDEILSINDRRTRTWSDVEIAVGTKPKRLIALEVKRGEQVLEVQLKTESRTRLALGYAGFYPKNLVQVTYILPGTPAEKAGLRVGDVFLAINGQVVYYHQFLEVIEKNPEKELEFLVDRDGEILTFYITLRLEGKVGKLGIGTGIKSELRRYSLFPAIGRSIKENWKLAFVLVNYVKDLAAGQASARQIAGPIEIARFSRTFFRLGFFALMGFIAFISLQLGIVNLFPIPLLDGGQILVLSLEGLFRKDFSAKVKQIVMQIGFIIFILLFVFVILNDVAKNLPNGWESFLFWK
ncbi:MAG: RIP metalloprotease RseP [Candidatus Aminicenantes bacterium]|nr:RIP metalloprotease RseP [Candidatus Aminicenantes bacterium]